MISLTNGNAMRALTGLRSLACSSPTAACQALELARAGFFCLHPVRARFHCSAAKARSGARAKCSCSAATP